MNAFSTATNAISDFVGGRASLGQQVCGQALTKAKLCAFADPSGQQPREDLDLEFFLNPNTIKITKTCRFETTRSAGDCPSETRWTGTEPITLEIGEMWFDTYESRESVREKYIDACEKLLDYDVDTHHPPTLAFVWGEFTQKSTKMSEYKFYASSLRVEYTMFLPDGTPVRAKVAMKLTQCFPTADQQTNNPKQSPDHAKIHVVRRGDTLQGIAMAEYDDPRQWRRIADTNHIFDPMVLVPGTKLMGPPILK